MHTRLLLIQCMWAALPGICAALQLHLEIEPGTFLLANSCAIVSTIQVQPRVRGFVRPCSNLDDTFRSLATGHGNDFVALVFEARHGHDGSAAPVSVRRAMHMVQGPVVLNCCSFSHAHLLNCLRYGAQHPIVVVKRNAASEGARQTKKYVVVGHCCESGDLLSPAPGEPETIDERELEVSCELALVL